MTRSRSIASRPESSAPAERSYAALTAREQRVKAILLQELKGLSKHLSGAGFKGLSYVEKQKLETHLDVSYIDCEIATMQRQVRRLEQLRPWLVVLTVLCVVAFGGFLVEGSTLLALLAGPVFAALAYQQEKAVRRRLYIFEALRALSDAEEIDVILSDATRDADSLIDAIVQRELEAEAHRPLPHRLSLR